MSPNPSESWAGPSGVNPENEIYLCDGLKCEPIDQEEETHQEVEQSQMKHQCADCGQSFKTTTLLKTHMKSHAQIKEPFQCSLCNKICKHRNHLIFAFVSS